VVVDFDWADAAARLLKAEIAREGITAAKLAERLKAVGLEETEASIKNKLYRGTFSSVFLLQCMYVLGRPRIDLAGVVPEGGPARPAGGETASGTPSRLS
jgi:hypothetical protein